jgi:hypothetical protein
MPPPKVPVWAKGAFDEQPPNNNAAPSSRMAECWAAGRFIKNIVFLPSESEKNFVVNIE